MQSQFGEICELLSAGESIAIATVISTRGSTPREIGAKMVVRPSGAIIGTVGGGCGEAEVWRAAVEIIHSRKPRIIDVDLTQEISMQSDGVCGGIMEVFVEAWWPGDENEDAVSPLAIARSLLKAEKEKRPAVLATIVGARADSPFAPGTKMIAFGDTTSFGSLGDAVLDDLVIEGALDALSKGEAAVIRPASIAAKRGQEISKTIADLEVFVEPFKPAPTLLICGAGHIAVPLAKMAKLLDFEVAVIDDRASFANKERFPEADQVIVSDFVSALQQFPINNDTYIVLITRGHQHDVVSLRQVIDSPAAYIGMIGSRRRVFAVFKLLHDEGMPLEKLAKVYSPIGIDLGSETPAEIALSIVAEVVKVMRGGKAASLSEATRDRYMQLLARGEDLS